MLKPFIDKPIFTVGDLARIAGIERGLADVWVHRGVIEPTRVAKVDGRNRPLFSLRAIFRAKLLRLLTAHLTIGPTDSANLAQESSPEAATVAMMFDNEDWMMAVLNNRRKPFKIWAAVSRIDKGWKWKLFTKTEDILDEFDASTPFIVLPLWSVLLDVYRQCESWRTMTVGESSC